MCTRWRRATWQAVLPPPVLAGNTESCTLLLATPGTAHIKLVASSAFSGVNSLTRLQDGCCGHPKSGHPASKGNWLRCVYTVPSDRISMTFTTSGDCGDAYRYLRRAVAPDTASHPWRSNCCTKMETCTQTVSAGDDIHTGLQAYNSISRLTLYLEQVSGNKSCPDF